MQINFTYDSTNLKAKLDKLKDKVNSVDMMRAGQTAMMNRVVEHIDMIAAERHNTANKLGASPTRHYNSDAVTPDEITDNTASVRVAIPGIARAYHDIDIYPVNAKALTIPLHSMAYGVKVSELKANGVEIFRPKGTSVLGMSEGGVFVGLYALVSHVHQPQDPTLMPDYEQLKEAAIEGMTSYVDAVIDGLV